MNEFQAILTVITFFAARFAIPALVIYTLARLARRYTEPESRLDEAHIVQ